MNRRRAGALGALPVLVWVLASVFVLASAVVGHAVYIGYGQGQWEDGCFSGQLAYNTLDLLQALEAEAGRPLDELTPPEFDALTGNYLARHFLVVAGRDTLTLEILKRRQKGDSVLLEFRMAVPPSTRSLRVRNDVLMDLFPQQVNTLVVRSGDREARFVFHARQREWTLAF